MATSGNRPDISSIRMEQYWKAIPKVDLLEGIYVKEGAYHFIVSGQEGTFSLTVNGHTVEALHRTLRAIRQEAREVG